MCNGRPPSSTVQSKRVKTLTSQAYNGGLKIRSINEQSARSLIALGCLPTVAYWIESVCSGLIPDSARTG